MPKSKVQHKNCFDGLATMYYVFGRPESAAWRRRASVPCFPREALQRPSGPPSTTQRQEPSPPRVWPEQLIGTPVGGRGAGGTTEAGRGGPFLGHEKCQKVPGSTGIAFFTDVKSFARGVWRNGSASDSRSEGWEFESLCPHVANRFGAMLSYQRSALATGNTPGWT